MKRAVKIIIGLIALGLLGAAGFFGYRNLRGIGPAIQSPAKNIASIFSQRDQAETQTNSSPGQAVNTTDFPLTLPAGMRIDLFAADLTNARVVQIDRGGNVWVSQPQLGQIQRLKVGADGAVASREVMFTGLDGPHGFAFDPDDEDIFYIAEEGRLIRSRISKTTERTEILQLPTGSGHSSRTVEVGPDKQLYVTAGSSCNVCRETDSKRAAMWVVNRDGSKPAQFATGLRNTVFFAWRGRELWGNDMGRDLLGDNLPPDEVNIITEGKDYGWPYCYGQKVHDTKFDSSDTATKRCAATEPSHIDLQAHSAPLGLTFITDPAWPAEWQGDALVAYHGSWNRSVPTGYAIVRLKLSPTGDFEGTEDFVRGWLSGNRALGRPVDLKMRGANLYVSDDKAGVIYRVYPAPK